MLYPIQEKKLYGFINSEGDIKVNPCYNFVEEFSENMACVCYTADRLKNTRLKSNILVSGFINADGEEVISPKYVGANKPFREGLAIVMFLPDWKWGIIDKSENLIISQEYDLEHSAGFSEGMVDVSIDGMWGYVNKSNQIIIPCEYEWKNPFRSGFAIVRKKGKNYFIDKAGNKLRTIKCNIINTVNGGFKDGGLAVIKIGKQYGIINTKGELAIEDFFEFAWGFHEGLCAVKKNGKYGYINFKGEFIVEPRFEEARPHNKGVATFSADGKWGLLNASGDIIKEPTYDYISHFGVYNGDLSQLTERELTRATKGREDFYINRKGEIVAPVNRNVKQNSEIFFDKLFEKSPERKDVWDKAEYHYDGLSITKKGAVRVILFVLKWLKEKELLTEEGLSWLKENNNLDIGLYRSMVSETGADFLDKCYESWYENEAIINFQIDPNLKFENDEKLNDYWIAYIRGVSSQNN